MALDFSLLAFMDKYKLNDSPKLNAQDGDSLDAKMVKAKKKSQAASYLLKDESDKLFRKALRIDKKMPKDEEDEETVRQLRDNAVRLNQEAQFMHQLNKGMSLGEKILHGFISVQVLLAAFKDLSNSPLYYGMTKDIQALLAERQELNSLEFRAIAVEHMIDTLQNINDMAIERGLIDVDRPLLTAADRDHLQTMANIMRDPDGTPEKYASVCQELGLDGKEAYKFYETEKNVALGMEKKTIEPAIDVQAKETIEMSMEL